MRCARQIEKGAEQGHERDSARAILCRIASHWPCIARLAPAAVGRALHKQQTTNAHGVRTCTRAKQDESRGWHMAGAVISKLQQLQ